MARQNLPPRGSFAAAAAPADPRPRIDYTIISINYVNETRWHGDRMVYLGSQAMGVARRIQPRPQRGAEDAKRHFAQHVPGGLRRAIGAGAVRHTGGRDLPNQGSRQHRRRAAEPADRLWPG